MLQLLDHSQHILDLNAEVLRESEGFCKHFSSYQLQVVYIGQYFETLHSLRLVQLLAQEHSPYRISSAYLLWNLHNATSPIGFYLTFFLAMQPTLFNFSLTSSLLFLLYFS